jgi:acyl-coenzyme A synthetase/AMP-(fatty) acid ligase
MQLVDMVFFWAKTDPHRLALIQSEMMIDYQGLADAITSIGERISQLRLDRREPTAVSLASPSYFIATVLALLRTGHDTALVNPRLFPQLHSAGVRNLIYDTQGLMLSGGRNIRFDKSWLPSPRSTAVKQRDEMPPVESADTIFFTSGTTGLPKKIIQAGGALEQLLTYPFTCASGNHQKILIMPGLASTFGFNRVCEILNVGKTACFAPGAGSALPLVSTFGIDMIVASAAQALSLVEAKTKLRGLNLDSLKAVLVGGGKIGPERINDIRAALCGNILIQYGSTEAGVVALASSASVADAPGAVGYVLPWVNIEIVDEAGQPLSLGAEGLIRYQTPQLIENLRAAGSDSIPGVRDQWFYPGDIGSVTADGLLFLTGRSSDVINRAGIKVSGTRIEEILQALPEIKEAAACGVTGKSGIEELWVAIVPKGSVDTSAISRQLSEHSDVRIAPDEVFVLDELPRGELGKIQKYRLKELMLAWKRKA